MSSESKRMNNDSFKSSSTDNVESLLPEKVIKILQGVMESGFLDCDMNLMKKKINDSMIPELCEWLVKLGDKVKSVDIRDNEITSLGASILFDTLKATNSSIKQIYLSANPQIDDNCMKSLGEFIKSNKNIEVLWLGYNKLSDAGIEILVSHLHGNTSLKRLIINGDKGITDKSTPLLMKMIELTWIQDINVTATSIAFASTLTIPLALNGIKRGLAKLTLVDKGFDDNDMENLSSILKKFDIDKLREIDLRCNSITSKGASVLFDTLKECKSVVSYLDLSNNQLDDECMKQLGEYLQDNNNLLSISVGKNKITDQGIEILSEYLVGNTTLDNFELSLNNELTHASVPHLIEMINKSGIAKLDVDNTSISKKKREEIEEALRIPADQRQIPIKSNTKSAAKILAPTSAVS